MPEHHFVQLIIKTRTGKDGKEQKDYYFRRDGAWWQVIDPGIRHPEVDGGIDLKDGTSQPNSRLASAEDAAELDAEFFPKGWDRAWKDFAEQEREKLQILFLLLVVSAGVDPDHLKMVQEIRQELEKGKSLADIWEERKVKILQVVLITLGTAAVAGVLLRFARKLFRRYWPSEITRKVEGADSIELEVKRQYSETRKKVRGDLRGRVDGDTLRVDSSVENWVNDTGQRGLVRELAEAWVEDLKDFARRRGLREVVIDQIASSADGVRGLVKMGFSPVPGRTLEGRLGQWRLVIPID